jgi:hypothetical protein
MFPGVLPAPSGNSSGWMINGSASGAPSGDSSGSVITGVLPAPSGSSSGSIITGIVPVPSGSSGTGADTGWPQGSGFMGSGTCQPCGVIVMLHDAGVDAKAPHDAGEEWIDE